MAARRTDAEGGTERLLRRAATFRPAADPLPARAVSYGSDFTLTLWTADPGLARDGEEAGVDRVGLDLEKIGKKARQHHLNTWISEHAEADLPAIRSALRKARLFVRTNPLHAGSREEIHRLIDGGAEVLMLPMFHTPDEAASYVRLVAGRADVSLLLETASAARRVDEIVRIPGIHEIHVGLNDLRISRGLGNHFEVLACDSMRVLSDTIRAAGIRFGFGGIGRVDDGQLPVPSDLVYAQYPRLEADRALIARAFFPRDGTPIDLTIEVDRARRRLDEWSRRPPHELARALDDLRRRARALADHALGAPLPPAAPSAPDRQR